MSLKVCCGAVMMVLVAACTPSAGPSSVVPSPSPSPSVVSPTPSPSPSPSVVDELAPIRAGLEKYWAVRDRIAQNPQVVEDPNLIASVAVDQAATSLATMASTYRDKGLRFEGRPTNRDLRISAPETKDGVTTSTATYCADYSRTRALDSSGKEIPRVSDTLPTKTTLTKMPSGNWLASYATNSLAPC